MLARFARYLEGTWNFDQHLARIRDSRLYPQIPTVSLFLSAFGMYALRLPSFNELEQQLKIPGRWESWVGPIKPSADAMGYGLEHFDLEALREVFADVAHEFKRKKSLKRLYPDSYWVGAIDGIELYSSRKRCCSACSQRQIHTAQGPVVEYYHRYVVLQLIGVVPALLLDIEPVGPGETEVAAASRLLLRVKQRYPRFLDVLSLDALYLQAAFVKKALELGYHLVIVLKQETRELYQDAEGLCQLTDPQTMTGMDQKTQLWDLEDLTSWSSLGRPIRVVRSLENKLKRERIAGQRTEREIVEDWRWVITLPQAMVSAQQVARWGHARWDEETRGFGELTQHWHLNHCYHHHPQAMLAGLLILFLAFCLTTVFFDRNLKPARRKGQTRLGLARLLADDLVRCGLQSFWARPP
jgi:hypothetical protein